MTTQPSPPLSLPPSGHLERDVLVSLQRDGQLATLEDGAVLIRNGEVNRTMYVVWQGELAVHLDDKAESEAIACVGPGDTVGELSLLDGSAACATVVAKGQARVLAVDERAFWELINQSHAFAVSLLMRLADRLRDNNSAMQTHIELREHFEHAAFVDSLTGTRSRRWLDENLARLIEHHRRIGRPLTVAMVDVDHFKRLNDTHGHAAGDAVLSLLGARLRAILRPTDYVARYGGEEFAVLLPEADIQGGLRAIERVRASIASAEGWPADTPELPTITISSGVCQLTPEMTPAELFARADAALYEAKRSGRNRVIKA
ncbi:MAG: GGDEF domain-containing protein [Myxococcales bacterium]|nr:GGDEF domain-containing protein [Myxococcales bacterium]